VTFAGAGGQLVLGAGFVVSAGRWSSSERQGWYVHVGMAAGFDVGAGGEGGKSDSEAAFKQGSEGTCGGVFGGSYCKSSSASGDTRTGGFEIGLSDVIPASVRGEIGYTFIPSSTPVVQPKVDLRTRPDATAVSPKPDQNPLEDRT
jgi:hypothetical protein